MRRADIQGLRAIAILLVVAYHGHYGVPGGFVGVDVFFAISGYVITGTLVRELERDGRLSLAGFYTRRVKRLLPALAVMVAFVVAAGTLLAPVAAVKMNALTGIAASVFGANWYLYSLPHGYFDPATTLDPLLHTWTLGVEEQFYLVYPVLLLVAWRLAGRRTALAAITVAGGASFLVAQHSAGSLFGFYGSPARAWEFGAGAVCMLAAARVPAIAATALAATAVVLVGIAAAAAVPDNPGLLIVPVAGTCAALIAGTRTNLVSQALALRPLAWIGDLSYSWYLWHWPLIVFAAALTNNQPWAIRAAAALSIAPAWASYRFLENPIRTNKQLRGRPVVKVAAVCVATPLLLALLVLQLPSVSAASVNPSMFHADVDRGCDSIWPIGASRRPDCTWATRHPHGTVVLIGDSNAGHFTEPVTRAANQLGYNALVATASACPFVDLHLPAGFENCQRFNQLSLRWMIRHRPVLVIVGIRADEWIENPSYELPVGDGWTNVPAVKQEVWAQGLRREITALNRVGVPVVVVHPVPEVDQSPDGCAAALVLLNRCAADESRALVDLRLRRTLAAEEAAVRGADATVLQLEDHLCSPTTCGSTHDGLITYRDRQHLSVAGALLLTGVFRSLIRQQARQQQ